MSANNSSTVALYFPPRHFNRHSEPACTPACSPAPSPLHQGPLSELFDQQQLLYDVSGAGNNWAHGHHGYGPQYREPLCDQLRRAAEDADSLQGFLLLHSLGGGTGSGLGTYLLGLMEVRGASWDAVEADTTLASSALLCIQHLSTPQQQSHHPCCQSARRVFTNIVASKLSRHNLGVG